MNTYRRILVPIAAGRQGDILLHRAAELARAQRAQILVVQVIDTRSGFSPDGPAAVLPGEAAARRVPEVRKRLELQLARNNLGWAEVKVVWGEPKVALTDVIRDWKPDVVVACAGHLSNGVVQDADVLTVGCTSFFRRLSKAWSLPVLQHA